jgi:hypothetical protein
VEIIRNSARFALICGVFVSILFVLARYLNSNPLVEINHLFIDTVIFGVFIFFAASDFKKYRNGGILHFWQGMSIGFIVYFSASVIFTIFLLIYFQLDDTLLSDYIRDAMNFLEVRSDEYINEFGQEQFEEQKKAINETNAGGLVRTAAIKKIIAGLFVTPVISIILRKKPKE